MPYEPPPSTLLPGSIVDTYLRDSGNEKQDRSVQSQLMEVQAYCQAHQLVLRHIYKDTRSGKSIVGRKDFERMIDAEFQRPKQQWWLELKGIASQLANPEPQTMAG